MDIRESFSGLKKKLKHRLTASKRKPDRTGADADGERVDSTDSFLWPEPHVVAGGGHEREGNGANAGQVRSTGRPPQPGEPEPVPGRGTETDQEGGEADVEVTVGSGYSREEDDTNGEKVERVYPSPSTPPIPRGGTPDSM
jgi:hypothetical protein